MKMIVAVAIVLAALLAASWNSQPSTRDAGWTWDDSPSLTSA